jgi:hypothetical protein
MIKKSILIGLTIVTFVNFKPIHADSAVGTDEQVSETIKPQPKADDRLNSRCTYTVTNNGHVYKGKDSDATKLACQAKEDPVDCV